MSGLRVQETREGCMFRVHVVPGSRQDAVVGLHGDALRIRLKAPPVAGKANQALRAFLAERLHVSVDAVEIVAGHASRDKIVRIAGVTPDEARERLLA